MTKRTQKGLKEFYHHWLSFTDFRDPSSFDIEDAEIYDEDDQREILRSTPEGIDSLIDKLKVQLYLAEKLRSANFSVENLLEIIVLAGAELSSLEDITPKEESPDIFEDPLNRGDALGNVKMITRRSKIFSTQLDVFQDFGQMIAERAHELRSLLKQLQSFQQQEETAHLFLDRWDEQDLTYRKSARIAMSKLKHSLFASHRRELALEKEILKLQKRIEHKENCILEIQARMRAYSQSCAKKKGS